MPHGIISHEEKRILFPCITIWDFANKYAASQLAFFETQVQDRPIIYRASARYFIS
jgi:hypothetical protein